MILRLVRGRVPAGHVDAVRAGLADASVPRASPLEGLSRAHVGMRPTTEGHDIAFISAWTSADAAMAVVGRDVERAGQLAGVSEYLEDVRVDHYEVDESVLGPPGARPLLLRFAAGVIELGADVEIQREIRARLGQLGDRVVEAYVGRRLHGRTVEVLLVTLWTEQPADLDLDAPIWPDISDRYGSLWIEIYEWLATW